MSVVSTEPAPESLTEIVPLLIGATVGEVERELVLHTLARCDGNRRPLRSTPGGARNKPS